MQKFSFNVNVVADALDREAVVESIRECLTDALPGDVHASVKTGEVKTFSEQGWKVFRARVIGITAEQAGDSATPKKSKKVLQETE